jgi:beta-phosphoglucomutase-like phosphatase (HAD superfamily)
VPSSEYAVIEDYEHGIRAAVAAGARGRLALGQDPALLEDALQLLLE